MRVLVVGGCCSGVGKTTLICRLLEVLPGWAALKVSPTHPARSGSRSVGVDHDLDRPFRIETAAPEPPHSDTARFRTAGSGPVVWVRSRRSHLAEALRLGLDEVASCPGVVVEGNAAAPLCDPDGVVLVARDGQPEIKESARALADRVGWVVLNRAVGDGAHGTAARLQQEIGRKPAFVVDAGRPEDPGTAAFLDAIRAWARR